MTLTTSPRPTPAPTASQWASSPPTGIGMPGDNNRILNVARLLRDKVAAPVLGGIAVNLHGAERTTVDLDLYTPDRRKTAAELEAAGATWDPESIEDDRLRLVFTCCHPSLSPDAQVALTLREVCGLTTEEIAQAFLSAAPVMRPVPFEALTVMLTSCAPAI